VHECTFANLRKEAPSGSAGAKITARESSNTLAGVRKPCCRNRRLPPLLQATVKCQEYMLLHYLDTDSSWRKGEICRNSGHREWSMPSASSTSSPLDKVVNITRMCTVPSLEAVPRDQYRMYQSTFTSRTDGSAAGGGRLHTCSGTDRMHLRYSSRRTS
jgi:hypothetical protein